MSFSTLGYSQHFYHFHIYAPVTITTVFGVFAKIRVPGSWKVSLGTIGEPTRQLGNILLSPDAVLQLDGSEKDHTRYQHIGKLDSMVTRLLCDGQDSALQSILAYWTFLAYNSDLEVDDIGLYLDDTSPERITCDPMNRVYGIEMHMKLQRMMSFLNMVSQERSKTDWSHGDGTDHPSKLADRCLFA